MGPRTGQRRIWDPKPIFFSQSNSVNFKKCKRNQSTNKCEKKVQDIQYFRVYHRKERLRVFWWLEIGGGRSSSRWVTGPRDGLKCTYWKKEKKKRNIRMEANTDETRSTTSLASNETYDCSIPDLRTNDRRKDEWAYSPLPIFPSDLFHLLL